MLTSGGEAEPLRELPLILTRGYYSVALKPFGEKFREALPETDEACSFFTRDFLPAFQIERNEAGK